MTVDASLRAALAPPAAFDGRLDAPDQADPAQVRHVRHQSLLRCYQARYVTLPETAPPGGVLAGLDRHYDEDRLQGLALIRPELEAQLILPLLKPPPETDVLPYIDRLLPELQGVKDDPFLTAIEDHPHRAAHYRNFLVQSSADLLAEASASALGVIGEFGPPQSALFRILIDEFGYGTADRKHSVLYRATLRSFGLNDAYNHYWPLFDAATLELHNAIHWLFQNPRNIFRQFGFLLFAETAYQRSTLFHARFLNRHFPDADARYFAEHAHIDLHHTRMVVDEVIAPMLDRFGPEIGAEIVQGAELTRLVFRHSGENLTSLVAAFDAAGDAADFSAFADGGGRLVSPASVLEPGRRVQVGAIGTVTAAAFARFPPAAAGRVLDRAA